MSNETKAETIYICEEDGERYCCQTGLVCEICVGESHLCIPVAEARAFLLAAENEFRLMAQLEAESETSEALRCGECWVDKARALLVTLPEEEK